jgi:mono/diheme cytochrome c family protein
MADAILPLIRVPACVRSSEQASFHALLRKGENVFDYVGVGILVILLILFGFLTWRSWRARNRALKWVGTIVAGLLTLLVAVVTGAGLYGFSLLNRTHTNPVQPVAVVGTPEQIARGQKLALGCTGCHSTNGQQPLGGQNFTEDGGPPVGTLYAANLTPGGETKDWSDGEIIRAIREGIHKNGRSLLIMPSSTYRGLSDEDVQALVAFLRSQPAEPATPPTNINLVGALLVTVSGGAFLAAQEPIAGPVTAPPAGPTAEYGQYLAYTIGGCRDCHGPNLAGGAADPNGPAAGPNITTVGQRWSEADFMKAIRTGTKPDGTQLSDEMPWKEISAFTNDDDLRAIYAFLKTLPPTN